jgi:hypothetical protein
MGHRSSFGASCGIDETTAGHECAPPFIAMAIDACGDDDESTPPQSQSDQELGQEIGEGIDERVGTSPDESEVEAAFFDEIKSQLRQAGFTDERASCVMDQLRDLGFDTAEKKSLQAGPRSRCSLLVPPLSPVSHGTQIPLEAVSKRAE